MESFRTQTPSLVRLLSPHSLCCHFVLTCHQRQIKAGGRSGDCVETKVVSGRSVSSVSPKCLPCIIHERHKETRPSRPPFSPFPCTPPPRAVPEPAFPWALPPPWQSGVLKASFQDSARPAVRVLRMVPEAAYLQKVFMRCCV